MKYRITHSTRYTYSDPVPVCHNQVHLAPRNLPYQSCQDYQLRVVPEPSHLGSRSDFFGNRVDFFAIDEPHIGLTVTATSTLNVNTAPNHNLAASPAWEELAAQLHRPQDATTLAACQLAFPSHHIIKDQGLAEYARVSFQPGRPVGEACRELTTRIFTDFKYDPKATNVNTPVHEVFLRRAGVCQDFAHLQISMLRSLGLAARYVSGYLRTIPPPGKPRLVGVDASHAWLAIYAGKLGWIDFDPTNDVVPGQDHVTLAWGRDYADVCPIQGVFVGGGSHAMTISVDVNPLDTAPSSASTS